MSTAEGSTPEQAATIVATDTYAAFLPFGLRLSTLTTFLVLFLPLFALTSLVAWLFLGLQQNNQRQLLQADVHNRMMLEIRTIQQIFTTILGDLLFLSEMDEIHQLLEGGNAETRAMVTTDFLRFASCKNIYDQVRYLDATGKEVVRINFNNGRPSIVPDHQLQDQATRDDFRDAMQLPHGSISISPLDLNTEHNQIERPAKPAIRFATPVFDRAGQRRGIIVLNYLAAALLSDFKMMMANIPGETYLLNKDGYWLVHPDPSREWGFMHAERRDVTFANAFPEAWHRIQRQPEGQFETPQGIFTFATLWPTKAIASSHPDATAPALASATALHDETYRWIAVNFLPIDHPLPGGWKTQSWLLGFYGGTVLVFAISAWLLALSRRRLQDSVATLDHKVRELEEARHELVQYEKMASLGRMVAGFAHEINTPIGIAVGAASQMPTAIQDIEALMQAEEVAEEELTAHLDIIRTAADLTLRNLYRAAQLMQSFKRTSADQTSEQARRFNMAEAVDDVINNLRNTFKHSAIQIDVDCPPNLILFGKPGVYAQILTNLLMNSYVHAFAEGSKSGFIHIWVRQLTEKWLWLIFKDNGCGMDETTRQQVFEPFFSTRRQHGDTGLGLYICHNLVTNELKGTIECQSHPDQGTRWIIEHPLSDSTTEEAPA